MTSIVDSSIQIQTSSDLAPCAPSWFEEVVLMAAHLKKRTCSRNLCEQVRFARKRFGRYEVIDFLAVLFGYAIGGERTDSGSSTRTFRRLPSHSWPCLTVIGSLSVRR